MRVENNFSGPLMFPLSEVETSSIVTRTPLVGRLPSTILYKYQAQIFILISSSLQAFTRISLFTQQKKPIFQKSLTKETMVAFITSAPFIGKNPSAFLIPTSEEEKGSDFVPEPPLDKEKTFVWVKHVLILFSFSDKLLVFLGPFPLLNHTLRRQ